MALGSRAAGIANHGKEHGEKSENSKQANQHRLRCL
jgi:hypothetical protein